TRSPRDSPCATSTLASRLASSRTAANPSSVTLPEGSTSMSAGDRPASAWRSTTSAPMLNRSGMDHTPVRVHPRSSAQLAHSPQLLQHGEQDLGFPGALVPLAVDEERGGA